MAQAIEVNPPKDVKTINFGRSDTSYGFSGPGDSPRGQRLQHRHGEAPRR